MCLNTRISRTDKRIKNPIVGKKYIICYSKARISIKDTYYPLFCNKHHPYNMGWNESFCKREESILFDNNKKKYIPHFHRFRSIEDARGYHKYDTDCVLLKWLVPVDSITTVGLQSRKVVVITKRCKLLGETK